jgi:hypothetical protein
MHAANHTTATASSSVAMAGSKVPEPECATYRDVIVRTHLAGSQPPVVIDMGQWFIGVQIDAEATVATVLKGLLESGPAERGLGGAVH